MIDMPNTNAVRGLRGPKYENWPLGDPRAAAPGKYDLKSGENGHLARANGATGGPYCSPALPSVCGRQFEPLAGRGGGFGARSCTGAAVVALGVLLQIEWRRKTRGTQAFRSSSKRCGRDGCAPSTVLRRGQGRTMRLIEANWHIWEPAISKIPACRPCVGVNFGSVVSDRAACDVPVVCRSDVPDYNIHHLIYCPNPMQIARFRSFAGVIKHISPRTNYGP